MFFTDQPSEMMWCWMNSSTCSRSPSLSRFTRVSLPLARSKGRSISSRTRCATCCSRACSSSWLRSSCCRAKPRCGRICCSPLPCALRTKRVRRLAWRCTRASKANSSAATSSSPVRRKNTGMLYKCERSSYCSMNHRPLCDEDSGPTDVRQAWMGAAKARCACRQRTMASRCSRICWPRAGVSASWLDCETSCP